jgi:hypothetical protein
MPYVLIEEKSGELLSCVQLNGYQLPYYGILLWESAPDPAAAAEALAKAGKGVVATGWASAELTEHQAKMANVKLRNDSRRFVYLREGNLHTTALAE